MLFFEHTNDLNILVIRHGESRANVDSVLYRSQANRDIELSDKGHHQASMVGAYIESKYTLNKSNTLLFSSSYLRASQTSRYIGLKLGLIVYQDDRLVERNYGIFEGLKREERFVLFPNEADHYQKNKELKNKYFTRMPMGESPMDVSLRFHSFWSDVTRMISKKSSVDNIIIVAHKITNRVIKKELLGYDVDQFEKESSQENCSIMNLYYSKDENTFKDLGTVFTAI